jgi:hypothetical protein
MDAAATKNIYVIIANDSDEEVESAVSNRTPQT